jgi:hypothetical protein
MVGRAPRADASIMSRAGDQPGADHPSPRMSTAALAVSRTHPQDIQDRVVNVWLDGEPLGKLKYGATITREIAPGPHTLKAHNTLFGCTATFDAAPGEQVRYKCQNGLTGGGIVMVLMLGVAYLRVRLERET